MSSQIVCDVAASESCPLFDPTQKLIKVYEENFISLDDTERLLMCYSASYHTIVTQLHQWSHTAGQLTCLCGSSPDDPTSCHGRVAPIRDSFDNWVRHSKNVVLGYLAMVYDLSNQVQSGGSKLYFTRHRDLDCVHTLKFTSTIQNHTTRVSDPVKELWVCRICTKDAHPGLLHFLHGIIFDDQCLLITKYAPKKDLIDFITKSKTKARQIAGQLFAKICYSLDYLHNHLNIAHLDLKPENIFMDNDYTPIIGDFGLSHIVDFPAIKINTSQAVFDEALQMSKIGQSHIDGAVCPNECHVPQFYLTLKQLEAHMVSKPELLGQIDYLSYGPAENITTSANDFHSNLNDLLPTFLNKVRDVLCLTSQPADTSKLKDEIRCYIKPGADPSIYSDFILDRGCLSTTLYNRCVGTRAYMAPEILRMKSTNGSSKGINPFKADIYSLGIVLFVMIFQFRPYTAPSSDDKGYLRLTRYQQVPNTIERYFGQVAPNADQSVITLLNGMLRFNPKERLSIKQVIALLPKTNFDPIS